ncbi:hypothetical protein PIB30_094473, partial [Stylosanthes scabra]|nr:hypothetical protein [Stylosanthes scabra]
MAATPSLGTNNNVAVDGESNNNHQHHPVLKQEEEDGMLYAMDLGVSVVFPFAVKTAFELGIFDIIAKDLWGPASCANKSLFAQSQQDCGEHAKLSAQDIASQIGSKNPNAPSMVDRLLRLLASHSLLSSSSLPPQDDNRHQTDLQ